VNSPRKRKRSVLALLLLLLLLAGAGAYRRFGADPALAKAQALQQQLRAQAARNLSPQQRRELWQQFRATARTLSPRQRRELGRDRRLARQKQLKEYFKLSKRDRTAYLDRQIDRMQARRREQQRNQSGARGGNGPAGAGGRGPGAGGWGAGGPGGGSSAQDRLQRRMAWLDQTTPDERAMWSAYRKDLNQRLQQRGLPTWGGRGGPR
jgi:hypothetical protein